MNYIKFFKTPRKYGLGGLLDEDDSLLPITGLGNQDLISPEVKDLWTQEVGDNDVLDKMKRWKEATKLNLTDQQASEPPTSDLNKANKAAEFEEKGPSASKMQMAGQIVSQVTQALDAGLMGDKNFGSQSTAIDSTVHATSSALINSGNIYAAGAGMALEAGNFLTKATGETVEGFDVDINNSGYSSDLMHQESKSSRDFLSLIGLGGLNQGKIQKQLADRNEKAMMALKAANISDEIEFEQEARMNSVDDVLRQNKIALQGGIDTSILAAKQGGTLNKKPTAIDILNEWLKEDDIQMAKNGAKLKSIELEEDPNLLPTGALHKNKNNLDLENITPKGIPVLQVGKDINTENINTAEDLQLVDYQQNAEVEASEQIFSKSLTDIIEEGRNQWNESKHKDKEICLEIGKKLCKEILFNNIDNGGVTDKMEEQVNG